ncbi:MAG: hypothetical protein Q8M07_27185 [Prosthecobacter sp.]|nr:hypothetical protein [Prosthecobacter sp.]
MLTCLLWICSKEQHEESDSKTSSPSLEDDTARDEITAENTNQNCLSLRLSQLCGAKMLGAVMAKKFAFKRVKKTNRSSTPNRDGSNQSCRLSDSCSLTSFPANKSND